MDGAFCSASSKTAFILSMKVLSDSVRRQVNAGRPACLDEAVRHKRFARSRPTIQDQAARGRHAKLPIALGVFERVGDTDELFLGGIVADDVVEFVHKPSFTGLVVEPSTSILRHRRISRPP